MDPSNVKEYFCEKMAAHEQISISVAVEEDVNALPARPVKLEFISEKVKKEGWHLPVHWFRRPYLYLYIIDHSGGDPGMEKLRCEIGF